MITIADCLNAKSISDATISVLNKVLYSPRKGYTVSFDGRSYWDDGFKISSTVNRLHRQLSRNTFKFSPCRKVTRKQKSGKVRDFYISTWTDKIVEKWLNDSFNQLLNKWFSHHSYAYRIDELGLDSCQNRINKVLRIGKTVAKRDISRYFYTIDHDILLEKLRQLIDPNDYLYKLVESRIKFEYVEDGVLHTNAVGVPFGSALACTLANIYLTDIDKKMMKHNVHYFRYADDFMIVGDKQPVENAVAELDSEVANLKLALNKKHSKCLQLNGSIFFKHLGLMFNGKTIRLPIEKQRKIFNFFKLELYKARYTIKRVKDIDERLKLVIGLINDTMTDRVRSVAIIDYYLKHVNDVSQLKVMDRLIAELVISITLHKPFRKSDFGIISYKKLRQLGLLSLVHRHRLHKHGHIKINFMSLYNSVVYTRYINTHQMRRERIMHMRMAKKLAKVD